MNYEIRLRSRSKEELPEIFRQPLFGPVPTENQFFEVARPVGKTQEALLKGIVWKVTHVYPADAPMYVIVWIDVLTLIKPVIEPAIPSE